MGNFIDLTGQRFGKLTVIKREHNDKRGETRWLCKCDCGKETIVLSSHIRNYRIRSCGCLRLENQNNIITQCNLNFEIYIRLKHIFSGMKRRCMNIKDKNYKNYGGRGIKICDEWLNKEKGMMNFCKWAINNGYEDNLTIDRIDTNGNYEPDNCRWVSIKEQENNRRDNVFLKYKGKVKTLKQWAETTGISYNTVYSRYAREIKLINNSIKKQINVSKILYKEDLRKKGV